MFNPIGKQYFNVIVEVYFVFYNFHFFGFNRNRSITTRARNILFTGRHSNHKVNNISDNRKEITKYYFALED